MGARRACVGVRLARAPRKQSTPVARRIDRARGVRARDTRLVLGRCRGTACARARRSIHRLDRLLYPRRRNSAVRRRARRTRVHLPRRFAPAAVSLRFLFATGSLRSPARPAGSAARDVALAAVGVLHDVRGCIHPRQRPRRTVRRFGRARCTHYRSRRKQLCAAQWFLQLPLAPARVSRRDVRHRHFSHCPRFPAPLDEGRWHPYLDCHLRARGSRWALPRSSRARSLRRASLDSDSLPCWWARSLPSPCSCGLSTRLRIPCPGSSSF